MNELRIKPGVGYCEYQVEVLMAVGSKRCPSRIVMVLERVADSLIAWAFNRYKGSLNRAFEFTEASL